MKFGTSNNSMQSIKVSGLQLVLGTFLLGSLSLCAQPRLPQDQQTSPDNTAVNKRDRDKNEKTADQQKMNPADREMTRNIRKAIHADSSLSTYAHNIKIITIDGNVTLKGPVRTEDEKAAVEAKAAEIAGKDKVQSQISVVPKKKQ